MDPKQHWTAFATLVGKEIHRFTRIWLQTLLPPVITTVLYFIIFGNLIGRNIPPIHGYTYMEYIVPGLVMMSVINNAYTNVVFSFFSSKFQRFIEEMLVSPMPSITILLGYLFGGVIRGLLVGAIVLGISLFFSPLRVEHPILMLVIALLTSALFSLGGFINAMFAKTFDDVSIVPTFILGPLTYLGGVFYSIHLLSPTWQTISLFNPILYIVNAFRYSCLGVADIGIEWALSILVGCTVILFIVAYRLLERGYGIRH